jgi:hypothetical protein
MEKSKMTMTAGICVIITTLSSGGDYGEFATTFRCSSPQLTQRRTTPGNHEVVLRQCLHDPAVQAALLVQPSQFSEEDRTLLSRDGRIPDSLVDTSLRHDQRRLLASIALSDQGMGALRHSFVRDSIRFSVTSYVSFQRLHHAAAGEADLAQSGPSETRQRRLNAISDRFERSVWNEVLSSREKQTLLDLGREFNRDAFWSDHGNLRYDRVLQSAFRGREPIVGMESQARRSVDTPPTISNIAGYLLHESTRSEECRRYLGIPAEARNEPMRSTFRAAPRSRIEASVVAGLPEWSRRKLAALSCMAEGMTALEHPFVRIELGVDEERFHRFKALQDASRAEMDSRPWLRGTELDRFRVHELRRLSLGFEESVWNSVMDVESRRLTLSHAAAFDPEALIALDPWRSLRASEN